MESESEYSVLTIETSINKREGIFAMKVYVIFLLIITSAVLPVHSASDLTDPMVIKIVIVAMFEPGETDDGDDVLAWTIEQRLG